MPRSGAWLARCAARLVVAEGRRGPAQRLVRRRDVDWSSLVARLLAAAPPVVALWLRHDATVHDVVTGIDRLVRVAGVVVVAAAEEQLQELGPLGRSVRSVPLPAGMDSPLEVARRVDEASDVVVVTAGAHVGPLSLQRLRWVALSEPDVASVSAAEAAPAPVAELASHLTAAESARVVAHRNPTWAVELDCPSGLVTYVRSGRDVAPGREAWHALAPHATAVSGAGAWSRHDAEQPAWLRRNAGAVGEAARRDSVEPGVLYVSHGASPHARRENAALLAALQGQSPFLLESMPSGSYELLQWIEGRRRKVEVRRMPAVRPAAVADSAYEAFVCRVIADTAVEAVHVMHLFGHPVASVARVATAMGLPVSMTLTDDYLVNPHRVQRISPNRDGDPGSWGVAERNASWLAACAEVVHGCRRVVTSTQWLRDLHVEELHLDEGEIDVDEALGPVVRRRLPAAPRARRTGPPRVVSLARWGRGKGIELTREVATMLGPQVEWHFLGEGSSVFADLGVAHPAYDPDEVGELIDEIDADLGVLLHDEPDPDGRVLAELWARGLEVVATDIGANQERIEAHGGGELVPVGDPRACAEGIRRALRQSAKPGTGRDAPAGALVSATTSGVVQSSLARTTSTARATIGLIANKHSASEVIRLTRPAVHAHHMGLAELRDIDARDLVSGLDTVDYSTIVVQRASLDLETARSLTELVRRRGIRLLVDLDDDLVSESAWDRLIAMGFSEPRLAALAHVLAASDLVTVSTENLRRVVDGIRGTAAAVAVPNHLDGRLWNSVVDDESVRFAETRLLYMGTVTHRRDLELLVEPLELLNTGRRRVTLDVVGVSDGPLPSRFMSRVRVGDMPYATFVRWMRSRAPQWTAGVAPLHEDALNRSKSDLKLLEYALAGLPAVASDYGPYRGRDDLATVVANDPHEWAAAIESVVRDPAGTRQRQHEIAASVRRDRTWTAERVEAWVDVLLHPGSRSARHEAADALKVDEEARVDITAG